ncbi:hypothetical protein BD410DRAFT_899110 [Rickenella mellea]|uniref:Uncharacterized protein n=1 Tax=Rickenella mellea TaxID=50990 RepID=A0A4Y7Q1M6_9AGAM|nr:hypothetical protein BD410DRAFT_899110 [Rickenella mellea]
MQHPQTFRRSMGTLLQHKIYSSGTSKKQVSKGDMYMFRSAIVLRREHQPNTRIYTTAGHVDLFWGLRNGELFTGITLRDRPNTPSNQWELTKVDLWEVVGGLRAKLADRRSEQMMFQHDRNSLQIDRRILQNEHTNLQAEHTSLQNEHKKLHDENTKLHDEHTKLEVKFSELQDAHAKLQEEHGKVMETRKWRWFRKR